MPGLFDPFTLKGVTLRNRLAASPMCQYSGEHGRITDWHRVHYAGLARGGSGLVVVEATNVAPEGRITEGCLGVWDDGQVPGLAGIAASIRAHGAAPGIQLAHAGRKACANRPWEGDGHLAETDPAAWETIAASAVGLGAHLARMPRAMVQADIDRVQHDFAQAAIRALEAGFEWLELHFAHGYLAQTFFSPHANVRQDSYGGSLENRERFLMETLRAVRAVWPERFPLSVRLGVLEFDDDDEERLADSIHLLGRLKQEGLDLVDVSMGFNTLRNRIPWGPALMAPVASRIRAETGLPTAASWALDSPEQADTLIREGNLDLVMLGRRLLEDPHFPFAAARALGVEQAARATLPVQYAHWLQRERIA